MTRFNAFDKKKTPAIMSRSDLDHSGSRGLKVAKIKFVFMVAWRHEFFFHRCALPKHRTFFNVSSHFISTENIQDGIMDVGALSVLSSNDVLSSFKLYRMRYVAAYLLASLGGSQPASGDIEKILGSVGIEIDDDRLKQVMSSLSGKDLAEVIEAGITRVL